MTRRLLTPLELCALLAIPISTVYGWRQTGDGPAVIKVGRLLRYDTDDVELWLKSRKSDQ